MRAHVLLNLLNELGKRDNNEFNKFNNTRTRMLDSIYHMTLRLFEISFLPLKVIILHYVRNVVMDVITFHEN